MKLKATIIQKVREKLDIRDANLTEMELFQLLEKTRNRYHPDNSTNEDVKEVFEQKFKEHSDLLIELSQVLVKAPVKKSKELVHYEVLVEKLKAELREAKNQIVSYKQEVARLQDRSTDHLTEKLHAQYLPNPVYPKSLAVTSGVGVLLGLLLQVDAVSAFFARTAPLLSTSTIAVLTLLGLLFVLGLMLRRRFQLQRVQHWTQKVRLNYFYRKFYASEIRAHHFNESEVINFIYNEFYSRSKWGQFYEKRVLDLRKDTFVECLKEIMVANMLGKDIIRVHGNREYQRLYFFK